MMLKGGSVVLSCFSLKISHSPASHWHCNHLPIFDIQHELTSFSLAAFSLGSPSAPSENELGRHTTITNEEANTTLIDQPMESRSSIHIHMHTSTINQSHVTVMISSQFAVLHLWLLCKIPAPATILVENNKLFSPFYVNRQILRGYLGADEERFEVQSHFGLFVCKYCVSNSKIWDFSLKYNKLKVLG